MPDSAKTPVAAVTPWIERWLLAFMMFLTILMLAALIGGSRPAQRTEDITRNESKLLCMRIRDNMASDRATNKPISPETVTTFNKTCAELITK